jgi:GNAT superfamily N-acetyltransferase
VVNWELRRAEEDMVDALAQLEAASYPSDEAAAPATIRMRVREASPFFQVALIDGEVLAGFVNGTLSAEASLRHESMFKHDPRGHTLCVHSVVVDRRLRRKGLGLAMLRRYVEHLRAARAGGDAAVAGVERVVLCCKEPLKGFYERAGFKLIGPSSLEWGKDKWFEMTLTL